MIVGDRGPAVVLSPRTAAWLEKYAGLSSLRVRVRGTDPEISKQLEELRFAAMTWRGSACGTERDTVPEPTSDSEQWLSSGTAAALAGVSSSAIRKAIRERRLAATEVAGRYRISREDVEHYKAARAE